MSKLDLNALNELPKVERVMALAEVNTQLEKLSAEERRRNLVGCMTSDARAAGQRILLIDDVLTTGSTAAEAARALLSAGAESVSILTAAKTGQNDAPLFEPERSARSYFPADDTKP